MGLYRSAPGRMGTQLIEEPERLQPRTLLKRSVFTSCRRDTQARKVANLPGAIGAEFSAPPEFQRRQSERAFCPAPTTPCRRRVLNPPRQLQNDYNANVHTTLPLAR